MPIALLCPGRMASPLKHELQLRITLRVAEPTERQRWPGAAPVFAWGNRKLSKARPKAVLRAGFASFYDRFNTISEQAQLCEWHTQQSFMSPILISIRSCRRTAAQLAAAQTSPTFIRLIQSKESLHPSVWFHSREATWQNRDVAFTYL